MYGGRYLDKRPAKTRLTEPLGVLDAYNDTYVGGSVAQIIRRN